MKITNIRLGRISVPLRVPFKTAVRSVSSVEDVIVEIHTDTGAVGYGEAPPTGAVTGDTAGAIIGAGSCITKDVAPDALALTRPEQREIPGWAAKKRERQG